MGSSWSPGRTENILEWLEEGRQKVNKAGKAGAVGRSGSPDTPPHTHILF